MKETLAENHKRNYGACLEREGRHLKQLHIAMTALLEIKKSERWLKAWTLADEALKQIEGEK